MCTPAVLGTLASPPELPSHQPPGLPLTLLAWGKHISFDCLGLAAWAKGGSGKHLLWWKTGGELASRAWSVPDNTHHKQKLDTECVCVCVPMHGKDGRQTQLRKMTHPDANRACQGAHMF